MGVSKSDKFDEEKYGVKYANDCEVCKIVTSEFLSLLDESKGKHEVLETGYSVEKKKKKTKYAKSELRLIETRSVCHFYSFYFYDLLMRLPCGNQLFRSFFKVVEVHFKRLLSKKYPLREYFSPPPSKVTK